MPDDPITFDRDLLARIARVTEPHYHAMLQAIRAEFGQDAPTMLTMALGFWFGAVARDIPHAERIPDAMALVWGEIAVPFSLEPKVVQ